MERRALQIVWRARLDSLGGLFLVWAGARLFFGQPPNVPASLDNQLRYLAGVYFGTVTLTLWWALPRIEERHEAVRIAAIGVFLGGIGRVVSIASVGLPERPAMLAALVVELVAAPLLVLWQRRVAALRPGGTASCRHLRRMQ